MSFRQIPPLLAFTFLACTLSSTPTSSAQRPETLRKVPVTTPMKWTQLPAIPDLEGFAGSFAGVSGGALLLAGGANVVGDRWAPLLQKKWYDTVFVLEHPTSQWLTGFKLPRSLGYGVSVTTHDGVVCIGGSDSERHFAEVFIIQWKDRQIQCRELPPLPRTCANACGALLGETLYVAGGLESPSATTAMRTFWSLDLTTPRATWRELEPWPGPPRTLAVAGVLDGSFFLFSGTALSANPEGAPVREFLRDAYRFTPGEGWSRLADMPRPAAAAPSPAPPDGRAALLVFSGDDGADINFSPLQQHPGFPKDVLEYTPSKDRWETRGTVPFSRATAPTAQWLGLTVIPNGEVRPRVRTPEVWCIPQKSP